MGTIDNKLKYLKETKAQIAEAIKDQGVTVEQSDTFRSYADKIRSISSSGGATATYGVVKLDLDGIYTEDCKRGIVDLIGQKTLKKSDFEFSTADEELAMFSTSKFKKTYDGLAIGGDGSPDGETTTGIILLSTTAENSYYGGGTQNTFTYDKDSQVYYYWKYNWQNGILKSTSLYGRAIRLNEVMAITKLMSSGRTIYEALLDYYYSL